MLRRTSNYVSFDRGKGLIWSSEKQEPGSYRWAIVTKGTVAFINYLLCATLYMLPHLSLTRKGETRQSDACSGAAWATEIRNTSKDHWLHRKFRIRWKESQTKDSGEASQRTDGSSVPGRCQGAVHGHLFVWATILKSVKPTSLTLVLKHLPNHIVLVKNSLYERQWPIIVKE